MKVLALVGSTRDGSVNKALLDAAIAELPAGTQATVYSGLEQLPFYDGTLESSLPPAVAELRAAVADADALIFATPEYNGSVSAVLHNAIDWASRPYGAGSLLGKPALVLAASPSPRGAQWAREDLVKILTVAGAKPLDSHFGHSNAFDGLTDEQRAELAQLIDAFAAEVRAAA